ncbi:MAG: glutathione peroxidase [Acidobacteria bacterium]|nr:glutathione peroxidase [Acidobacteriota bacterium]
MRLFATLGFLMTLTAFGAGSIYDYQLKTIDGAPLPLAGYKNKVVLLVNVASQCGYTPQYAGLQRIWDKYKSQGLVLVGVPANNFGRQEPGTESEIKTFCQRKYSVSFPMTSKISVTGADADPLYKYLGKSAGEPKWNFTKYLVGKDGRILRRFDSKVDPESAELTSAIEGALKD